MAFDLSAANETLLEFERLVQEGCTAPWAGDLKVGVDLGTANIVLAVVDEDNRPVAGISTASRVVRDGIVVDYVGAVSAVTRMKAELEARLGRSLDRAATAIPPGIIPGNVKAIANVVEGAGFGTDTNVVTIITPETETELAIMSKEQVAVRLLDEILARL